MADMETRTTIMERLALLAEVTRPVATTIPQEEQLRTFCEKVRDFFAVDGCVLRALEGEYLVLRGSAGMPEHQLFPSISAQTGIPRQVIFTQAAVTIEDIATHPLTTYLRSRPGSFRFESYAGAPLMIGNRVTGILAIYMFHETRAFTPEELELLQIFANHAAAVLESYRLFHSLQQEKAERERLLTDALNRAERDPLTGLLNHNSYHRRLHEEVSHTRMEDQSFAVVLMDLDNFKFFNDSYGHAAGDSVLRLVAEKIHEFCRPQDMGARLGGDEFALLLPGMEPEERDCLMQRLSQSLLNIGFQPPGYAAEIPLHLSAGIAFFPQDAPTVPDIFHQADERLFQNKRREAGGTSERMRALLMESYPGFTLLDALVTSVDSRDRYTRRHSEEVFFLAGLISEELNLPSEDHSLLMAAALLHDVGKIGVPDRLLRLPMPLNEDEFEIIKRHTVLGAMLAQAAQLDVAAPLIRHHHESWDGSGYPDGISGEEIPLLARILAVADSFSAMTSDRPYRRSFPIADALDEIEAGSGVQWDPGCVAAFLKAYRQRVDYFAI